MTPTLVGVQGEFEMWSCDGRGYVGVAIRDEFPPAIKDGLVRRRTTALTGRCNCGAAIEVSTDTTGPLERLEGWVNHERGCPADDEWLTAAFAAWRAGLPLPDLAG
jgi:hypothetical protein